MFEHALFFDILEHPIATLIILVATTDAEKPAVITHDSPAELWYIRFKVNQILRLLRSNHVVEVNVFVAPFEVVDDSLVCELLFDDKQILEKLDDSLVYVKMVELGDHCLLIF
jgi:hypothetical protein